MEWDSSFSDKAIDIAVNSQNSAYIITDTEIAPFKGKQVK